MAWFPKNMMIRYAPLQTWKASQLLQAISLVVKNRIANEIEGYIFTSLTQMTARLIHVLAAIFNQVSLALNNIFVYLRVNTEGLL